MQILTYVRSRRIVPCAYKRSFLLFIASDKKNRVNFLPPTQPCSLAAPWPFLLRP